MIQTLLFFGLGFLSAIFIVLMFAPAYRRRIVRLTSRRIEASIPMTREEIQAEKDRQRSEFALSARRLEMDAKAAREKLANQAVETDRLRQKVDALEAVVGERSIEIARLETEAERLGYELEERDGRIAAFLGQIEAIENDLDGRSGELQRLESLYEDASLNASSRQIEIVAREAEIDRLSSDIAALRGQRNEADRQVREISADNKALREAMKSEARKNDELGRKVERLMADLSDRDDRLLRREAELARLKGGKLSVEAPAADAAGNPYDPQSQAQAIEKRLMALATAAQASDVGPDDAGFADDRSALRRDIQQLAAEMVHVGAGRTPSAKRSRKEKAGMSLADRIEAVGKAIESGAPKAG